MRPHSAGTPQGQVNNHPLLRKLFLADYSTKPAEKKGKKMKKTIDLEWDSLRLSALTDILDDEVTRLGPGDATNRVCALADSIQDLAHDLFNYISKLEPVVERRADDGGKE